MTTKLDDNKTKVAEEPKAVEFEIGHCQHPRGEDKLAYSLGILVNDCHIDVSTSGWAHQPGYYARISVYNLQPSDIKALGEAIIKEALKIERAAEPPEK